MSKILNLAIIALVATAFFMLKDELDKLKGAIYTINNIEEKVHDIENKLDNLNIRFEEEKKETEKFKEQATKTIFNMVKAMGVK